jgi:hypothetical protein
MSGLPAAADVADAVAQFGRQAVRVTPLHVGGGPRTPRASFRVELSDGTVVKVRRLESEAAASRQEELRAGLPEAFAPVVARFGPILVEAWIVGEPLNRLPPSEELIRRAGELLAMLHARRGAGGRSLPFSASVDGLSNDTLSGLQSLAASGILDARSADLLGSIIRGSAPADVPHCLIHTDYCGENIVVGPDSRLFVIDNEHFRFGPAAMDLARCRYRWGWSKPDDQGWRWFREAYEAAGGAAAAPRHEPFWRIAAVVVSARIRLQTGHPNLAEPLTLLRDMAASLRPEGDTGA